MRALGETQLRSSRPLPLLIRHLVCEVALQRPGPMQPWQLVVQPRAAVRQSGPPLLLVRQLGMQALQLLECCEA